MATILDRPTNREELQQRQETVRALVEATDEAEKKLIEDLIGTLEKIGLKYSDRLTEIEDVAERELIRIMTQAEGGIVDLIQKKLRAGDLDMDGATTLGREAERLMAERFVKKAIPWVDDSFPLAYRNGQAFARDTYLAGQQIKIGAGGIRLIDDDAVRSAFLNFTETDQAVFRTGMKRGYTLIKEIDSMTVSHLRETLVRHVALGSSTNDIADALIDGGVLQPLPGKATLEVRAQMIARTELARIHEDASLSKSRQVGVKLFRWSAILDDRTSADSKRRHGKIKTLEEWNSFKPDKYKGTPPLRPRDRCKLTGMKRNWIRDEELNRFDETIANDGRFVYGPREQKIIDEFEQQEGIRLG